MAMLTPKSGIVDHPEKGGLFSDFQYGFKSDSLIELLGLLTGLGLLKL